MTDDTDVLTLLRWAAIDDAPSLTLQATDLMRRGRRRRLATRCATVGAGVAVAAGAFAVFTVAANQGDQGLNPNPGPADHVSEAPPAESLHMMPALLKVSFSQRSMFQRRIGRPSTSRLGARSRAAIRASRCPNRCGIRRLSGPSRARPMTTGSTSGWSAVTSVLPKAIRSSSADPCSPTISISACTHDVLADGRIAITRWERDDQGGGFATPGLGGPWFVQDVKVYEEGSGYVVQLRQGVRAASLSQARAGVWLDDTAMLAVASSPDLDQAQAMLASTSNEITATTSRSQ